MLQNHSAELVLQNFLRCCRSRTNSAECITRTRTRTRISGSTLADSAIAALNCSGVILGTLPIRVSPSKTPVHSRAPRTSMQ
ncbi:polyadenylate-binding protein-interacting protein 12-like [Senna tora]|uniref:Polyadenylate-binding protein-interacting protein 12-like n=1 Tax=Senna tora TaxID=362788 RepID=A0A834TN14_9FABA|nr:polyadenylate-binding protein-interacting protein 12-like [Senna tora]